MKKKIYIALSADMLHKGHFNILNKAASLGEITVGLLTDKAIGVYKQIPFLNYSQREIILKEYPDLNPDHVPNVSGMFVREATGEDKLPEGLEKYDTVIGVNGKLFNDGITFLHVLEEYEVGEQVSLNVIRKGRFILVDVVLKVLPIDVELLYTKK